MNTREFWIDKYPVTRGQFLGFLKATGYKIPYNGWLVGWKELLEDPFSDPAKLNWPITGVNAADGAAYAKWLGKRLPTEIEWEKAARGTDGRLYPWGNTWKDTACYTNPGNLPLDAGFPVGSFPDGDSPYGVSDLVGSVLQWVDVVITPPVASVSGRQDDSTQFLAGSAPLHQMRYNHMVTRRLSWSHDMRIYDSGFRCVSDSQPQNLVTQPKYKAPPLQLPKPVELRADLFLKEPIRLEPLGCSTFKIHVPWFPESVWTIDSPEGPYGPFGGANQWPYLAESEWNVDWKVEDGGRRISYEREKDGKKIKFAAWVDGPSVEYWISTENMGKIDLSSFCFKTFSPFFSSQERATQNRLEGDTLVRSLDLSVNTLWPPSLQWSILGSSKSGDRTSKLVTGLDPGAVIFKAYQGPAYLIFVGVPGVESGGNGWPPCTHLGGPIQIAEKGGGRIMFWVGPLDGAKKYLKYDGTDPTAKSRPSTNELRKAELGRKYREFGERIDKVATLLLEVEAKKTRDQLSDTLQRAGAKVDVGVQYAGVWEDTNGHLPPHVQGTLLLTTEGKTTRIPIRVEVGGFHSKNKLECLFEMCMLRAELDQELHGHGDGGILDRVAGLETSELWPATGLVRQLSPR